MLGCTCKILKLYCLFEYHCNSNKTMRNDWNVVGVETQNGESANLCFTSLVTQSQAKISDKHSEHDPENRLPKHQEGHVLDADGGHEDQYIWNGLSRFIRR